MMKKREYFVICVDDTANANEIIFATNKSFAIYDDAVAYKNSIPQTNKPQVITRFIPEDETKITGVIKNWYVEIAPFEGGARITGNVIGHEYYKNNEVIITSPITEGIIVQGKIVVTRSGSRYYLANPKNELVMFRGTY